MLNKNVGIVLVVVGVLIVAAILLAAPLHLANATAGFGYKKIIVLVIGLIMLGVGLVSALSKGKSPKAN